MCYPTIQTPMDYNSMTYAQQRRERLNDAIFDYISDEETSMEELFDDIIAEVRGSQEYFARYEEKCSKLLEKLETVTEANGADWEDFWNNGDEELSSSDC